MSSALWHLDGAQARFSMNGLSGVVDLLEPSNGVRLGWGDSEVLTALAVDLPSVPAAEAKSRIDAWVRQGDLVATYAQTETRATRGQVYWRVHRCGDASSTRVIDLIASVQTSLLDSDPALNVCSRIRAAEVLQLTDDDSNLLRAVEESSGSTLLHELSAGPACSVFRLQDSQTSYVEMVHPTDFTRTELRRQPDGHIELSHRLFPGRLEKGVILRARLRAAFVPRENDAVRARDCYADFAASEPPLTV